MIFLKNMELLFWYCKSKIPGHGTIKLCIQMDGYPDANVTTKIKVAKEEWGGNRIRFKGTEWAQTKNRQLRIMEAEIETLYGFLQTSGYDVNPSLLAAAWPPLTGKPLSYELVTDVLQNKSLKHTTLLETISWHIRNKRGVTPETLYTYKVKTENLEKYLRDIGKLSMRPEDFNEAEALSFCDWFLNQDNKKGKGHRMSQNHLYKHIILYVKALKEAKRRRLIITNPLIDFTVDKSDVKDLRHLKPQELQKLEMLSFRNVFDPNLRDKLEKVRDLFVFCCYTGFHYSDRQSLKEDHLKVRAGSLWVFKKRQKTNVEAKIKLHPKAISILEKYDGIENLPKMINKDNNELLKTLEIMIGVRIGLCTKIARKTFAHHCLNVWNLDKDTTAAMMGLSSTKHISDYAEIDETRIEALVHW